MGVFFSNWVLCNIMWYLLEVLVCNANKNVLLINYWKTQFLTPHALVLRNSNKRTIFEISKLKKAKILSVREHFLDTGNLCSEERWNCGRMYPKTLIFNRGTTQFLTLKFFSNLHKHYGKVDFKFSNAFLACRKFLKELKL